MQNQCKPVQINGFGKDPGTFPKMTHDVDSDVAVFFFKIEYIIMKNVLYGVQNHSDPRRQKFMDRLKIRQ